VSNLKADGKLCDWCLYMLVSVPNHGGRRVNCDMTDRTNDGVDGGPGGTRS
jgi:hypothetical protein